MKKISSGTKAFIILTILHAIVFNLLAYTLMGEAKYLLLGILTANYILVNYCTGRFILLESKREANKGYFFILFHTVIFFVHNTVALLVFKYYAIYLLIPWITLFSAHFMFYMVQGRKERFSYSKRQLVQKV